MCDLLFFVFVLLTVGGLVIFNSTVHLSQGFEDVNIDNTPVFDVGLVDRYLDDYASAASPDKRLAF